MRKLTGADALIYKEKYFSREYVVNHTIVPETDDCPDMFLSSGAGRSGSTGLLALLVSHPTIFLGYYQPLKVQIRHGNKYGEYIIPSKSEGAETVFAKEVFGPFHKEEEFDPIDLLIKCGFSLGKIHLILLLRNPLMTFQSNFKFPGGIEADILISNIKFTINLLQKYKDRIQLIPFAYDLLANGKEDFVLYKLFRGLGLAYRGRKFDLNALKSHKVGGKLVLGECEEPAEYKEIFSPMLKWGEFKYVDGGKSLSEFLQYVDALEARGETDADTIRKMRGAPRVVSECGKLYEEFYRQSAEYLGIPLR